MDETNDLARRIDLDLLEERRLDSVHKNAGYKQRVERFYNSKIKIRRFAVGELVLKKIQGPSRGPFGPNWEGPFRVSRWLSNGAYELEHLDGVPD